ncbi:MAG: hypothetical protein AAF580_03010 [Pseudomonadota bacterium]
MIFVKTRLLITATFLTTLLFFGSERAEAQNIFHNFGEAFGTLGLTQPNGEDEEPEELNAFFLFRFSGGDANAEEELLNFLTNFINAVEDDDQFDNAPPNPFQQGLEEIVDQITSPSFVCILSPFGFSASCTSQSISRGQFIIRR